MKQAEFVHLHNHTEYSLLDGACRIIEDRDSPGELIKLRAEYKMPALAITDHGNMYGVIEFYQACCNIGIKPIIGCEIYLAPGSRFDKKQDSKKDNYYHLTLLAKDNTGYENLMEISSIGFLEGFYHKPRVDKEVLSKYSKGLICLSGCLQSELSSAILSGDSEKEKKVIEEYKSIFGPENFYIELMDNGIKAQKQIIKESLILSKATNTPVVATNDCHYLHKNDAYAHDILLCIGTGTTVDTKDRLRFQTDEFYYKSPQEMMKIFSEIPESIKNTLNIAERCSVKINFDQIYLPYYKVPNDIDPFEYLKSLCEKGLKERYGKITDEIKKRLDYELSIIKNMGFVSYFLIVWDMVQYAKQRKIPVGPGRGSGAGSIVSYCLGITNICPIKYGLLFERFLNPERRTMPDLDIDFADIGRDKIVEYMREKYGKQNVAQIITFGSMKSRLVVRDVARVLGFTVAEGDKIAKLIPENMTIYQALRSVSELTSLYHKDERYTKLIDISRKLEGLKRHTGIHAAGIVIAKDKITKYTPIAKSSRDDEQEIITTQYNDDSLLKLGLLKIDILGLRTLTILDNTVSLIYKDKKDSFNFDSIPLDDKKTFKLLQEAKTSGVFQLESTGMRDLLRKFRPTVFEDIIALIALYRPGPIRSGVLDEFVRRKHQQSKIKYDHPLLEPILKETYGIIVYQEQVIQVAVKIAGFTASQADKLRRAMSKKIPEEMEKERDNFIESAHKNNIDRQVAKKIFEQILYFCEYGFNKSHAAAYGLLAYYTAYFKANYPVEFMCSLMTSEISRGGTSKDEESKLLNYINIAKQMNIEVLPPDIQKSDAIFTIENGAIRFGLLAIKNVGVASVENIIAIRRKDGPFKSLYDFCARINTRQVNRKVIESLIKAGAFDFLGQYEKNSLPEYVRAKALADLDVIFKNRDRSSCGQEQLFEMNVGTDESIEPWPKHVLLEYEREVLGMYFSGHPLEPYRKIIETVSSHSLDSLPVDNTKVTVAGMIANIKRLITKKGEQMAKFKLENDGGTVDILVFPKSYNSNINKYLNIQSVVLVRGRVSTNDEKISIIADEIESLDDYEKKSLRSIEKIILKLTSIGVDDKFIDRLKKLLHTHKGNTKVYMKILSKSNEEILIETPYMIELSNKLFEELEKIIGEKSWEIVNMNSNKIAQNETSVKK